MHSGVETAAHRILRAEDFTDQTQGAPGSFGPGHLPVHKSTTRMETWTGHRRHSGHGGVSPGQRHGAAPAVDLHEGDVMDRTNQKHGGELDVKISSHVVFAVP